MKKLLTETELNKILKDLVIVHDTREQVNEHITGYFDKHYIKHIRRGLQTGDYSVQFGNQTLEGDVVIERKANIDEIAGNFTVQRERFEHEFERAKAKGIKVFLLIENCSWTRILAHEYRSKLSPKSLMASLMSWQARFNITVLFCDPKESGMLIHSILHYWLREELK